MSDEPDKPKNFAELAEQESVGLLREFLDFLGENQKWWLLPIILALLLVGVLLVFGGSAISPFLYPFF